MIKADGFTATTTGATGNITNDALMALFAANFDVLVAAFDDADFIELGPAALVVHRQNPTKPE